MVSINFAQSFYESVCMAHLLSVGQYQGFFQYGPEYGGIVAGKEAEFRLFVELFSEGQFEGRIIDWEGMGADGEIAIVKGFIKDTFISFTKQYPTNLGIDEWGNTFKTDDLEGYIVYYEGQFNPQKDCFSGKWEIVSVLEDQPDFTVEDVATGTWRMNSS